MERKSKEIYRFENGPVETVKISLEQYNGRIYFDARIWVQYRKDNNEGFVPTKKGIHLNIEQLDLFLKGLRLLKETFDKGDF